MKTKIGFNVHSYFSKMNDVNFSSDSINEYRHRAQMIVNNISSIPSDTHLADSEKKYDEIKERAYLKARELYGEDLHEFVKARLEKELRFISENDFSLCFWLPMKIADDSKSKGCPVMSRGTTGSSLVAYLLGLTHVNPLGAHYRCKDCHYIKFVDDYNSGFDLPAKKCPNCGNDLIRDGHNVPYETLFGFCGDKEPSIELNLCEEYKDALYETLFWLDILSNDAVQMLKILKEKTGVEPSENDLADNAKLLKSIKEVNTDFIPEMGTEYVKKQIERTQPQKFSDVVVLNGLLHSTGAYVYNAEKMFENNVCDFESVIAFRDDVLLYLDKRRKEYIERNGNDAPISHLDCYKISEIIRKGRAKRELSKYKNALCEIGVPDWYIDSAKGISYLFPKAHSVEYMIVSFKLLWYKLNYPNEYLKAYNEINKEI